MSCLSIIKTDGGLTHLLFPSSPHRSSSSSFLPYLLIAPPVPPLLSLPSSPPSPPSTISQIQGYSDLHDGSVLKKAQLHYNMDEFREIDDDALDDDVSAIPVRLVLSLHPLFSPHPSLSHSFSLYPHPTFLLQTLCQPLHPILPYPPPSSSPSLYPPRMRQSGRAFFVKASSLSQRWQSYFLWRPSNFSSPSLRTTPRLTSASDRS